MSFRVMDLKDNSIIDEEKASLKGFYQTPAGKLVKLVYIGGRIEMIEIPEEKFAILNVIASG